MMLMMRMSSAYFAKWCIYGNSIELFIMFIIINIIIINF